MKHGDNVSNIAVSKFGKDTLLIIPCCAAKAKGGNHIQPDLDPLSETVSSQVYSTILGTRAKVLNKIKGDARFLSGKYLKNVSIQDGLDLGGTNPTGFYSKALNRYTGKLYSVPGLKLKMEDITNSINSPKVIILSALYGPLHPHTQIQDYNLMMSDAPARSWSAVFPIFLKDYVGQNNIRQVILYVGSSTAYFRVAQKAVRELLTAGFIDKGIQYHVENGSTSTTPLQHGFRLLDDLDSTSIEGRSRVNGVIENIL